MAKSKIAQHLQSNANVLTEIAKLLSIIVHIPPYELYYVVRMGTYIRTVAYQCITDDIR